ncbi:MAG: hypothetical protein EXX96DRAFT_461395, partial [Benjaminiella poitrasii]
LRWRLGFSPASRPQPCLYHPTTHFSRLYAIDYFHVHYHLFLPAFIEGFLSFLLN